MTVVLKKKIERKAKIKFEMIGFPQPIDIIKASAKDIYTSIINTKDDISEIFNEAAELIIKEMVNFEMENDLFFASNKILDMSKMEAGKLSLEIKGFLEEENGEKEEDQNGEEEDNGDQNKENEEEVKEEKVEVDDSTMDDEQQAQEL